MNKATSLIIASLFAVSAGTVMADQTTDSSKGSTRIDSRSNTDNSPTGTRGGDAAISAGGQTGTGVDISGNANTSGAIIDNTGTLEKGNSKGTGDGPSAGSGPNAGKSYNSGNRKNTGKAPAAGSGTGTGSTNGNNSTSGSGSTNSSGSVNGSGSSSGSSSGGSTSGGAAGGR